MTQHTDNLGNPLFAGDYIHGKLWHRKSSHFFKVLEFSKPKPHPLITLPPDELMIRVDGGWVRFRDAFKVCDPSNHIVDQARMDELLHAEHQLNAMEMSGVDNWDDGGMVAEYLEECPCPCAACEAEKAEEEDEE